MRSATIAPMWSLAAAERLRDAVTCPVCESASLRDGQCRACGADLRGDAGSELWRASLEAAAALDRRQALRAAVPLTAPSPRSLVPQRGGIRAAAGTGEPVRAASASASASPAGASPRGSTTVQSLLAVAGAGLFAVAAVVFTFFNPDLRDHGARSLVTLAVTAVFLGGAVTLRRRRLVASAEAVGALGMVFVALDVYAVAGFAPASLSGWVFAGIGTIVSGLAMVGLAVRVGIRSWASVALVGLPFAPAMLGAAAGAPVAGIAAWITTSAAAAALIRLSRRIESSFGRPLRAERRALTVAQLVAIAAACAALVGSAAAGPVPLLWTAAVACAAIAAVARASARRMTPRLWSFIFGGAVTASAGAAALAVAEGTGLPDPLYPALLTAGPVIGFLLVTLIRPPRSRRRRALGTIGALLVVGVPTLAVLGSAAVSTLRTVASAVVSPADADLVLVTTSGFFFSLGASLGLALASAGFAVHARVATSRTGRAGWSGLVAAWLVAATTASLSGIPFADAAATAIVAVAVSVGVGFAVLRGGRNARPSFRIPLLLGAQTALVVGATVSWHAPALAAAVAPAVVASLVLFARTVPPTARWAYAGVGYAYALVAAGTALGLTGLPDVALLSLVTSAGAVLAIAATFTVAVPTRTWWALLAVTAGPFALGILQVVRERSGWTALSTGLIFLLALALVSTRRRGMLPGLRALCAAALVPSLSVVVICLGAEVLRVSASPITLPVIAVIVAVALAATDAVEAALRGRGVVAAEARLVRLAIEGSALLTAAVAVGLSLARDAAGLPTAVLVLVILAAGAGTAAGMTGRVRLWWVTGAAATGALWAVWRIAEVDVLEPYVLPPALGAALVGLVLQLRGHRGAGLVAGGLVVAVTPSLVVFGFAGGTWRFTGLVIAGALLAAAAVGPRAPALSTGTRSLLSTGGGALRRIAALVAILAAAAGPLLAVRIGSGQDAAPEQFLPFWTGLAAAALGAAVAAIAGLALAGALPGRPQNVPPSARAAQWALAPAVTFVAAGAWPLIADDWPTIWSMWVLLLVLLCAVVGVSARLRRGATGILPPVWFLFALAFVTAVVTWSPRELRVECFSLPLGAALLAAGALHLHRTATPAMLPGTESEGRTWTSWPLRWTGSWALLAPGLVVIMSASILATFTDPLTWRAILVIVMALVAILVGARWRLSAPFVVGIAVLPIENVSAFTVQIGRGIASMPWWITLAVVGAVLLILAVSYERQAGEAEGIGARLRDLR